MNWTGIIWISVALALVALFIYYAPKIFVSPVDIEKDVKDWQHGYRSAQSCIKNGEDPQYLYDQATDNCEFDRGWRSACRKSGAKDMGGI